MKVYEVKITETTMNLYVITAEHKGRARVKVLWGHGEKIDYDYKCKTEVKIISNLRKLDKPNGKGVK